MGGESRKTYMEKMHNGFFDHFMDGSGLDIGYKGYEENVVPILESAIGVGLDYPNYDGRTLPFADESQDYVYSSHVLEHISDYVQAIKEWYRVTKVGGHIITVVPHRDLYEKKETLPSIWNGDHKRFYTPASLLAEFESALPVNSFRVRHLCDNDAGHDYATPQSEHSHGEYELELVIERIK